jgi:hypothetical protein
MASVTNDKILALIGDAPPGDCLVLSHRSRQEFAGLPADMTWLTGLATFRDLPAERTWTVAILFDQLDHLGEPPEHLLAALRDRMARRVVVLDHTLPPTDFIALGFELLPGAPGEGYLFDPDSPARRREWNNPDHWANPENFDKYRW